MNMHCPVSCGVCEGACRDTHDSCPGWSREGECVKNPGHALKACPKSCKVGKCATGKCVDHNETACAIWALDDECLKNTGMMNAECPMSCGVCSMVCQDKEEGCLSWAVEGQCESNAEGMLTLCPAACGVCHDLEIFYRGAIGGGGKDEL
jgi:hypothetical protein